MNDPIYRSFRAVYNADGETEALSYLSQYFNEESWPDVLARLTKGN